MQVPADTVLSVRVPETLAERMREAAHERDRSVSYVIREALSERFGESELERAA